MDLEKIIAKPEIKDYYKKLIDHIDFSVDLAKKARKTNRDVSTDIESIPAAGIAEKTEILVGPKGVAKKYNELWEKSHDRFKVTLQIFDLILDKKLGEIEDEEKRLEQAIRTALVIQTDGVVVSPLDGLPQIKISKNDDGTKYPDIYYAGPIRAAGGNAQTLPLLLADYARKKLNLDRFKPSKKEVDRIVEEGIIYQNDVVTRQQRVTEKEIRTIATDCPICVNSGPDSDVEVMVNRDLDKVPSNRIRGAMCLVIIDGLYVRAMKILKTSQKMGIDWTWLEKLIKVKKTSEGKFELKPSTKYIEGLAAGRPVFSYPLRPGGFRLRYGKGRNTSLMAKAINPATMYVLDEFIAVGTHGRLERPGKSLQYFPCDSIDGPIVRLKNKSLVQLNTIKDAKENKDKIDKILFLGDMLIAIGDFRKSGHPLIKNGYVEEEWLAEIEYLKKQDKIETNTYEKLLEFYKNPNPYDAIENSLNYNIPLFPIYHPYMDLLDSNELKELINNLRESKKTYTNSKITKIEINYTNLIKQIFEKIGLIHEYEINTNKLIINQQFAYPLLKITGALNAKDPKLEFSEILDSDKPILEKINQISKVIVKDKSGTYIGARMGRPEAAHKRMIPGKPNVLFPLGHGFGNNRDMIRASKKLSDQANTKYQGITKVEIQSYMCPKCKKILFTPYCFDCKEVAKEIRYCKSCDKKLHEKICPVCKNETIPDFDKKINIDNVIDRACKNLRVGVPEKMNGVKGLVSTDKISEPLEKGILRSKNDLYVFKDGTIRYEALNATITQFKPKEIGVSLEKLKELGYNKDYYGKELKSEDQIITLFPQDIIIDYNAADYFVKVANFIDDLLEKFYHLDKYYNVKTKEDLLGELIIGLAPHTSAGIVGRIIGFSKAKLVWQHPFFITAKRRNVDGDQDSMLLLMDSLLNFSQKYLSKGRGGRMDAPLAFTTIMNPYEIDDESYEIETVDKYPYEFYMAAKNFQEPENKTEVAEDVLGTDRQYSCFGFTHNTEKFDDGPRESSYLTIKSMSDKVKIQAELQKKIAAVDNKDALERLLHYHLFPDIIGNTRAFARQKLRCVKCNEKFRRIPLLGKCTNCGSDRLILTIHEGSIKKYVEIAEFIIKEYELKAYLNQKINLAKREIESLFSSVEEKDENQKSLSDFF